MIVKYVDEDNLALDMAVEMLISCKAVDVVVDFTLLVGFVIGLVADVAITEVFVFGSELALYKPVLIQGKLLIWGFPASGLLDMSQLLSNPLESVMIKSVM